MNKYKIFSLAVLALVLIPAVVALADANTPITVSPIIPGSYATSSGPGAFVANFYQFALMIGGLLAFGMIVWGGVKYAASRGNPSAESDAKDRIYGALIGLLLLAGVYLILFTINPNLINLQLPTLQSVNIVANNNSGGTGSNIAPPGVGCTLGLCAPITGPGISCKPGVGCTADPLEVAALQCIQQKSGQNLLVTEGYPPDPTVVHLSQCHHNGCCVDTQPAAGGRDASCAQVQSIMQAAQACGVTKTLNEFTNCNGSINPTTRTGNNIHIQAC